jgi:hypothetical protein
LFVYQLLITWVDKINYKSMGQQEGTHLVSERIEGHISSQVIETEHGKEGYATRTTIW